jgi:hypothetical protein
MLSSGMLRRVTLVRTDISEESSASIIRVTKIGELAIVRPIAYCHNPLNYRVPPYSLIGGYYRTELVSLAEVLSSSRDVLII